MSALAILILVVTTVLSVLNMIIVMFTNNKFRERMSTGGKKVLLLADLSAGISVIAVMTNIIVLILEIFENNLESNETATLFFALSLLVTTADAAIILRFRGYQNERISSALMRNQQILNERNKIMANISHEIRTPMNTIIAMNEILLNDNSLPDIYKEKLNSISDASTSLLHVINNLIDFTKIESQNLDVIETNYVLKELIQTIVDKTKPPIIEKNVDFKITVSEDIPSVLHGDDIRIIQVISNVLDNACKFTNSGVIAVNVKYNKTTEDEIILIFEIQDTGMGIPERERQIVFNSSTINSSKDDHRQKGAGLGLLISKNIIDRMGGSISFETESGVGTTFKIFIPQIVVDTNPIGQFNAGESKNGRFMFKASGARALIVDDNIVNLFVAKELLERYDIEVQTASNGQECLDIVTGNLFDIIFMDYVMPGMDGHETLKRIRSMGLPHLGKVPVIALTAQTMTGADKVYKEEGFDGYLSKPLNVDSLEEVLLNLLPGRFIVKKVVVEMPELDPEIEKQSWYQRLSGILEGVNVKKGLSLCGNDYFSYINLLRVIYNDGMNQVNKLRFAADQGHLDDYRITIHAMKSVTASAGDEILSEKCKEHEERAKNGDIEFIKENVSEIIERYRALMNKIDMVLQREIGIRGKAAKNKVETNGENIRMLAGELNTALESFDVDEAEKVLEQFEGISLSKEQEKAIEKVRDSLLLFRYDEASEVVKSVFNL
ncbi:MAG: response regulator [Lachnospiraceae bacterium]|nr:response regulator [Lachnospiraceae bacterium]